MEAGENGDGESWRLPERARPPLLGELVERIDEALATARASEAAAMTVGAAALDAAEQAKRAAELAERASAVVLAAPPPLDVGAAAPNGALRRSGEDETPSRVSATPSGRAAIDDFSARADRLAERLCRLQRVPLSA